MGQIYNTRESSLVHTNKKIKTGGDRDYVNYNFDNNFDEFSNIFDFKDSAINEISGDNKSASNMIYPKENEL